MLLHNASTQAQWRQNNGCFTSVKRTVTSSCTVNSTTTIVDGCKQSLQLKITHHKLYIAKTQGLVQLSSALLRITLCSTKIAMLCNDIYMHFANGHKRSILTLRAWCNWCEYIQWHGQVPVLFFFVYVHEKNNTGIRSELEMTPGRLKHPPPHP